MRSLHLRPVRAVVLASALALASVLGGCAYLVADMVPGASERSGGSFFALPLRAMLTRDTINGRALIACDREKCGHDVVVGIIEARGAEARTLLASLDRPAALEAALARRAPDDPKLRERLGLPKPVHAKATVRRAEVMGRKALRIDIVGGPHERTATGFVVMRKAGEQPVFIVSISTDAEVAEGYAGAAIESEIADRAGN